METQVLEVNSLMKKCKKFVSVVMAILIVFALSSCDLIQDAEITPAIPDGIEAGDIRIGVLYSSDYEKEDTDAFIQQEAINAARGTYPIADPIIKNKLPIDNTEKIKNAVISCVKESGCNVVLSTDPVFTEMLYGFATGTIEGVENLESYKQIVFVCLDNTKKYENTENFHCFYPNYEQAYCLAGITAASKGDSNIKFTSDNEAYLKAFELGAKAVNPDAKIINGAEVETYGTVDTNWHIYYQALIENITLGKFSEMGNYFAGVETGFCSFTPAEDYASKDLNAKLAEAKAHLTDGTWDLTKAETIKF